MAILWALPLWVVGTVVFDAVHWVLHRMLRSRSPVLRALAWPHGVHHRWLDGELRIRWENQWKNVFCHLVPEYLTQLAFSGLLLLFLPTAAVLALALLQTGIFLFLLSQRGLDINHRPVEILDAYRPSPVCPPAYHALHHVHPDAYFSAYTKLVDQVVGGAAWLAGRRYALAGADTPLGGALARALERAGAAATQPITSPDGAAQGDLDVLLLCDPGASETAYVEAFVAATRERQLPPEVWSLHTTVDDPTARHYYRDVRVSYRLLFAPDVLAEDDAARAARTLLCGIRRGLHFVPARIDARAWRAWRRFRRTRPVRPAGVPRARSRLELARPAVAAPALPRDGVVAS